MKFKYEGYDKNSIMQVGTLDAENLSDAYAALQFQGVTVVNLSAEKISLEKFFSDMWKKIKLGGRWKSIFFRELGVMLGVMNLHDALQTLAESSSEKFAEELLQEMAAAVERGENFSSTLRQYEVIFGGETIQAVEVGEVGGKLQEVTTQIADRLERSYATQRKVTSAMYYPAVVLVAAIIAAVVMVNVTLPVFEDFYQTQGGELPLITQLLLFGGKFFAENFFVIFLLALAAIFFMVIIYHEVDAIKFFVGGVKWRIKIFREIELRNFFGRLSFLVESGITLNEAIKLCALSSDNLYVKKFLDEMQSSIERGEKFGLTLKKILQDFSTLYLGLIMTGEESGELSEMLKQCESMADFEVEETLRSLPAKAEVYGTLLAGLIVGALVFAVVLPILNMTNLF